MTTRSSDRLWDEGGFTLIEALVALALTGLVLSALATLTAQWMPSWNYGLDRIQQSEMIGISMQRITADLAAAEFVPPSGASQKPLFDGTPQSVTFVRTSLGPNVGVGLDVVQISEGMDAGHLVTLRSRAPFAPLSPAGSLYEQIHVSEPVIMMRPPLRLSFAYAGPDQAFQDSWHDMDTLPTAIMLTLRDSASGRVLSVSTVSPVHVNAPANEKSGGGPSNDGNLPAASPKQGGS
jgi:general secretion pathway protein J